MAGLSLNAGYEINEGRYIVIERLGFGDAGTVFKVKQTGINVERAMKVLDPKLDSVPIDTFAREFAAEREKLSQLTHRNLVKLIDGGELELGTKTHPYYVTDLIHPPEGHDAAFTLDQWAEVVKTREQFVNIVLQLTDGLSYLHGHQCMHCDIKPSNVMLEPIGVEYEVKIADLGSSKILFSTTADTKRTHIVGTPYFAPDYVQDRINKAKSVKFSELRGWFPHWDLFCLGATLARIVWGNPTNRSRNFEMMLNDPRENIKQIFEKDFDLFKRTILRLVGEKDKCFPNAESVAEAFRKFLPEYLVPLGVKEMAVGGAHRTITQPREKVYLSARAYELVEHPTFQRLHNQTQLNFVYMLYPGAKHTRFLHSLTTYEMAKRYIEGLLGDSYFKYLMDKQDFEIFLVAAMLHDVGQYPLAHAIEDLGDETFTGVKSGVKTDYQMSEHFLAYPKNEQHKSIAALLEKSKWIDVERLIRLLTRGTLKTEADFFIRSMLDGPLDVDKISYLLYDSYFTGARYGLGIDLDSFLSSLVAIPPEGDRHSQVGILSSGVVAAEGAISARYSMFSRVYWHHFNRSVMSMLKYAAAKIFLPPKKVSFRKYIEDTFAFSDIDAVRYLHDNLGTAIPKNQANPLAGLLDGSRRVHRRFLTFSGHSESKTVHIYKKLGKYNFDDLEKHRLKVIRMLSAEFREKLQDSDVLFDVPRSEKTSDTLDDLYVYDPEDTGARYKRLSAVSGVTKALCDEFENHTKKCRILVSAKLGEKIDSDQNKAKKARSKVEAYLNGIARK